MRPRAIDLIVVLMLSLMCVITSYKLKLDHNAVLMDNMKNTLQGHAWTGEVQNRLIAPWMWSGLASLTRHRLPDAECYKIVRMLTAFLAFGTVYYCTLLRTRSYSQALLATALCCYGYLWTTLTFFVEYPEDFLDLGFMYLLCWLCVQDFAGWVFPVMLLACLNRESGVFGGLVYAGLKMDIHRQAKARWRPIVVGLTMSALAYLFVHAVRYAYAGHLSRQQLGILETLRHWRWALQPFGWLVCLAGMFMPLTMLLWAARNGLTEKARRIVIAAGVILIPTCTFGILGETRVFLPVYALLVFAVVESGLDISLGRNQARATAP